VVAGVLSEMHQACASGLAWPIQREGLDALAPRFKRIYRRGRGTYRTARREPSSQNLHELRKRVKDLWYAALVVRPFSPKRMKGLARAAHELSDLIG
jgi:CHAD domain-containing protein